MSDAPQSYANHTRWHAPFHFFLVPLFMTNLIYSLVQLVRFRDLDHAVWFALALGFVVVAALTRTNALRVQDRLIRLEERLRYREVLPPALAERAVELKPAQMVALRFASDAELPGLVEQILDGRLTKVDEIKRAVKNWRADTLRV